MAKRAREMSDGAQHESVEVEAHQTMIDEAAQVDFIDIPFGGKGRSRAKTFVSVVNAGKHLNLHLSAVLKEVAASWEHGAQIRCQRKSGVPDVIHLRAATEKAYTLRPIIGKVAPSFKSAAVESWVEGDEICIRLPTGIFAGGEVQP